MTARILIVEDESIVQLDLESQLKRLGHSVVGTASAGEEAIAKAAELAPDLVLMDVRLEGAMDGIEAARRIQAARPIPIIYVTAYASSVGGVEGAAAPGACVSKPFRTTELQAVIAEALASSGPAGASDQRSPR